MEPLHLTTADGIKIAANYFPVDSQKHPSPLGWVVFLHMMPATKESWNELAERLRHSGYAGIAIDLRGHGASDGGPDGYREFSDVEHQDSVRDVDAAIDFLASVGAHDDRIVLIGASIGANLALSAIAHHRNVHKGVLISPGLDYHGIATQPLVAAMPEGKQLLFIGAYDDDRVIDNVHEVQLLCDSIPSGIAVTKELVITGGHGTAILVNHPELIETIVTFITS